MILRITPESMNKLIESAKKEIELHGYATIENYNIKPNSDDAKQMIYTMEQNGEYRLEISPDDKKWVIVKDKNYKINDSLLKTNDSVRKVNKMFIATIVISAVSLIASIFGLIVQLNQLKLQKQQLIQKQLPIKVEIPQPLQVDFPSDKIKPSGKTK